MDFTPVLIVIAGDPDTLPGAATKINTNLGTLAQLLAAMDHDTDLLHAGTNTHEAIDAFIASKAAASGLCDLDANLLVPTNRLPALSINETFVVASEVAMLALDCQKGDVALRSDEDTVFILADDDPSILANWKEWLYPTGVVVAITESGGQALTIGAIADGQRTRRTGTTFVGETVYKYRTYTIDNGAVAISTGSKGMWVIPDTGNIVEWTLLADVAGAIQLDLKKCNYAGYPTTASIVASAPPLIAASAQKAQSSTLTGWTVGVAGGDIIEVNVDSCTTISRVIVVLKIQLN